jgi:hypothetical protein
MGKRFYSVHEVDVKEVHNKEKRAKEVGAKELASKERGVKEKGYKAKVAAEKGAKEGKKKERVTKEKGAKELESKKRVREENQEKAKEKAFKAQVLLTCIKKADKVQLGCQKKKTDEAEAKKAAAEAKTKKAIKSAEAQKNKEAADAAKYASASAAFTSGASGYTSGPVPGFPANYASVLAKMNDVEMADLKTVAADTAEANAFGGTAAERLAVEHGEAADYASTSVIVGGYTDKLVAYRSAVIAAGQNPIDTQMPPPALSPIEQVADGKAMHYANTVIPAGGEVDAPTGSGSAALAAAMAGSGSGSAAAATMALPSFSPVALVEDEFTDEKEVEDEYLEDEDGAEVDSDEAEFYTDDFSFPGSRRLLASTGSGSAAAPALIPLSGGNDPKAKNLKACTGECDNNAQCAAGLKCFQRQNGEDIPGCTGAGGGKDWDYCYNPALVAPTAAPTAFNPVAAKAEAKALTGTVASDKTAQAAARVEAATQVNKTSAADQAKVNAENAFNTAHTDNLDKANSARFHASKAALAESKVAAVDSYVSTHRGKLHQKNCAEEKKFAFDVCFGRAAYKGQLFQTKRAAEARTKADKYKKLMGKDYAVVIETNATLVEQKAIEKADNAAAVAAHKKLNVDSNKLALVKGEIKQEKDTKIQEKASKAKAKAEAAAAAGMMAPSTGSAAGSAAVLEPATPFDALQANVLMQQDEEEDEENYDDDFMEEEDSNAGRRLLMAKKKQSPKCSKLSSKAFQQCKSVVNDAYADCTRIFQKAMGQ